MHTDSDTDMIQSRQIKVTRHSRLGGGEKSFKDSVQMTSQHYKEL